MRTKLRCIAAGFVISLMLAANSSQAATFSVTSTDDSGPGSLRQAVLDANATRGADAIVFGGVSGTIRLTGGHLTVTESLTVTGPGAERLTLSGNNASRLFYSASDPAAPIELVLERLTLAEGKTDTHGGALLNYDSHVRLTNVVLRDNQADGRGGAAHQHFGRLTLQTSTVSNNTAGDGGGGISFYTDLPGDELHIDASTITGNEATLDGGGVIIEGGESAGVVTVTDTLIDANEADRNGGGIAYFGLYIDQVDAVNGGLALTDVTVSNNRAGENGGGLYVYGQADLTPVTVTGGKVSANIATGSGGGITYINDHGQAQFSVSDTEISNNRAASGGGLWIEYESNGSQVLLEGVMITANSATATGGGLLLTLSEAFTRAPYGVLTLRETDISGNVAGDSGGGLAFISTAPNPATAVQMVGGTLSDNRGQTGGGVFADFGGTAIFQAVTAINNTPDDSAGGVKFLIFQNNFEN